MIALLVIIAILLLGILITLMFGHDATIKAIKITGIGIAALIGIAIVLIMASSMSSSDWHGLVIAVGVRLIAIIILAVIAPLIIVLNRFLVARYPKLGELWRMVIIILVLTLIPGILVLIPLAYESYRLDYAQNMYRHDNAPLSQQPTVNDMAFEGILNRLQPEKIPTAVLSQTDSRAALEAELRKRGLMMGDQADTKPFEWDSTSGLGLLIFLGFIFAFQECKKRMAAAQEKKASKPREEPYNKRKKTFKEQERVFREEPKPFKEQTKTEDAPMTRARALNILGLIDGTAKKEINAARKRLLKGLHPDSGGSNVLAALINRAADFLLK